MSGPDMLAAADVGRRVQARSRSKYRSKREMVNHLRGVPLFSGLSGRHLRRIASLATVVSFSADRTIVERGVRGDSFYLILIGSAKVFRGVVPTGRAIARLKRGDFFGEMALLDGGPRSATVVSESSLTALKVPRSAFRRLLLREPLVAVRILEAMAARTRDRGRSPSH